MEVWCIDYILKKTLKLQVSGTKVFFLKLSEHANKRFIQHIFYNSHKVLTFVYIFCRNYPVFIPKQLHSLISIVLEYNGSLSSYTAIVYIRYIVHCMCSHSN